MHNAVFLVPILISLGAFAMIFGIVYLGNREKMAMIERGMDPREKRRRNSPRYLKWAMLFIGAGIGLLSAFLIDTLLIPHDIEPVAVYFSLLAIGGGLGLVASYKMEKKEYSDDKVTD